MTNSAYIIRVIERLARLGWPQDKLAVAFDRLWQRRRKALYGAWSQPKPDPLA